MNTKNLIIHVGGNTYKMVGSRLEDICDELGISEERFIQLLARDFYCPTLSAAPTASTLTYTDDDGSTNHFQVGQMCRWKDSNGVWQVAVAKDVSATSIVWYTLPTRTSQLQNDSDFATNASVDSKVSSAKTSLENSMAQHKADVDAEHKAHKSAVDKKLTDMQVEFETLITEHRDYMYGKLDEMEEVVTETQTAASEAERVSYQASVSASQAATDAASAVAAVASLQGLANATEAQQTLAGLVTQIEANRQAISIVPTFELYKETNYDL